MYSHVFWHVSLTDWHPGQPWYLPFAPQASITSKNGSREWQIQKPVGNVTDTLTDGCLQPWTCPLGPACGGGCDWPLSLERARLHPHPNHGQTERAGKKLFVFFDGPLAYRDLSWYASTPLLTETHRSMFFLHWYCMSFSLPLSQCVLVPSSLVIGTYAELLQLHLQKLGKLPVPLL